MYKVCECVHMCVYLMFYKDKMPVDTKIVIVHSLMVPVQTEEVASLVA